MNVVFAIVCAPFVQLARSATCTRLHGSIRVKHFCVTHMCLSHAQLH